MASKKRPTTSFDNLTSGTGEGLSRSVARDTFTAGVDEATGLPPIGPDTATQEFPLGAGPLLEAIVPEGDGVETDETPESPTITLDVDHDAQIALADEPPLPGMIMSDEPLDIRDPQLQAGAAPGAFPVAQGQGSYTQMINDLASRHGGEFTPARNEMALNAEQNRLARNAVTGVPDTGQAPDSTGFTKAGLDGELIPPEKLSDMQFTSRIRVLEAYQYPGFLGGQPAFVDPNWAGYAGEEDAVRGLPAGPCLRVPVAGTDNTVVICRKGDFVVLQAMLHNDRPTETKIEVWPNEQFKRLFIPTEA